MICAAAMLAGCSDGSLNLENETAAPTSASVMTEEKASEKAAEDNLEDAEIYIPKDKLGEGIIDEILREYIDKDTEAKLMSEKNSVKLEEAFKNIRINNSRFALPMMIMALPQGFSVKIDYDSKSKKFAEDFRYYSGELLTDGEMCAAVMVMMKENSEEKYGIILGITATMSSMCKWSFGDIKYSNDTEKLNECFGEPSAKMNLSSSLEGTAYVTQNGSVIIFYNAVNGITCMSLDIDSIVQNMLLTEYVPYDDFDGIPEIPELTGEPREIDWNKIFDDNCIIIGNEKCPAIMRIGDLPEDITLFDFDIGKEHYTNPDYFSDSYQLMYKDREIGLIGAFRKKDEKPEDAVINSWMFTGYSEYKFPAAVMDIPLSQDFEDVSKIFTPHKKDDGLIRFMGIAEKGSEKYMCTLNLTNFSVIFSVTPASVDVEAHESFLEKLNEQ